MQSGEIHDAYASHLLTAAAMGIAPQALSACAFDASGHD
jgi:hypothetical protein